MKKKIDLKKFKIANLSTMKTLRGGTNIETTGNGNGDTGTIVTTLPPVCLTNTEPDPDYNSDNPLNPNTCVQTSAVNVTGTCNNNTVVCNFG